MEPLEELEEGEAEGVRGRFSFLILCAREGEGEPANGRWLGESIKNVVVRLSGSVETVTPKMRRVNTIDDDSCT